MIPRAAARAVTVGRAVVVALSALLAAHAASAAPPPPASTPASSPVKVVRLRDLLRAAIDKYHRSEFRAAEAALVELRRYVRGERSREAQEVHTYLAFVHVALGRNEQALKSFERALKIKPDLQLKDTSPKIARLFAQARRRYRAKVRALDHDPPRLLHVPRLRARHGSSVKVLARATDVSAVGKVLLNYRIAGNRGFATVKMERDGEGRYLATIPSISVVRPGVEYFIEAWDSLGNGPGLKGSPRAPIRVEVEGGPLAKPAAAVRPRWYQKWWVWAIVASAVLTAGGVGVGIYLARDQQARLDLRWNGGELDP